MEVDHLHARHIASDVVVTEFDWPVFPVGSGPAFHGVGSRVYVLREGRWAEVLEHETVTKLDEGLRPGK